MSVKALNGAALIALAHGRIFQGMSTHAHAAAGLGLKTCQAHDVQACARQAQARAPRRKVFLVHRQRPGRPTPLTLPPCAPSMAAIARLIMSRVQLLVAQPAVRGRLCLRADAMDKLHCEQLSGCLGDLPESGRMSQSELGNKHSLAPHPQ